MLGAGSGDRTPPFLVNTKAALVLPPCHTAIYGCKSILLVADFGVKLIVAIVKVVFVPTTT
jgi:hypothetical protein